MTLENEKKNFKQFMIEPLFLFNWWIFYVHSYILY